MSLEQIITESKTKMEKSVESFKKETSGLRTGRASANLLDTVFVSAYGNSTALSQVASVNVPEPRMLSVSVWDKSLAPAVDKAIREAGLGLNPILEGSTIRVPIPAITEERRKEFVKVANKHAEECRVSVRNIRRDSMERLKKFAKDTSLSEDIQKAKEQEIQKLTDNIISTIDSLLKSKEQEIMKV